MSANSLKRTSLTDWERLDQMTDDEIDTSDIPPLDETWFESAELRLPKPKQTITIRLDEEIVNWFKQEGKGYQTRINAVLKMYVEQQTAVRVN